MKRGILRGLKSAIYFCLLAGIFCTHPTDSTKDGTNDEYKVHLCGTILSKDNNPVPYAVVELKKYHIKDYN